jgi:hypothetical protein
MVVEFAPIRVERNPDQPCKTLGKLKKPIETMDCDAGRDAKNG